MIALYLTKMEKATFGAGKEVWVASLSGVDRQLMSWATSSPRDDEELPVCLKPLIRMTVAAEK
jgi:hypothetical protein